MDAGLYGFGIAVPTSRLRLADGRRRVAVCDADEDVITLAVAAARHVIERGRSDADRPRAIVLATTSAPRAEGAHLPTVAAALRLSSDVHVEEHSGSIAVGGTALAASLALVKAGMGPVLYIAADVRRGLDGTFGDGAIASLLGEGVGPYGNLEFAGTRVEPIDDAWRPNGSLTINFADGSFVKAANRLAADAGGIAVTVDGPPIEGIGTLGATSLLAHIAQSAESAPADGVAVTVRAGGVSTAVTYRPGERVAELSEALSSAACAGRDVDIAPPKAIRSVDVYDSVPRAWRDAEIDLGLVGQRDADTGEVIFPPVPYTGKPNLHKYPLGRSGTVFTNTMDHVYPHSDKTEVGVVELDGGGRFYGQAVGGADLQIGKRVELVLRRLYTTEDGLARYFWKIAPASDTFGKSNGDN